MSNWPGSSRIPVGIDADAPEPTQGLGFPRGDEVSKIICSEAENVSNWPGSSRIPGALNAEGGPGSSGISPGRQALEQLQSSLEHGTSPSLPPWHPDWKGPYRIEVPPHLLPPTSLESSGGDTDSESAGSDCSGYSSPLYEPVIPKVPVWKTPDGRILYGFTDNEEELDMYYADLAKFEKKKARQELLPTLVRSFKLQTIYSSKQKAMILHAAKSMIRLSAYHGDKVIGECSGAAIEWDESDKFTTILTSAWIFCTHSPFDDWSEKNYAPKAKVVAHLLDGSTHDAQLLYYSQHYDLALFQICGESLLQNLPLCISLDTSESEDIIVLARDINLDLICKKVNVLSLNPCEHQHNHYQFIDGSIPKCGTGGVLLGANGNVRGMLFYTLPNTAFISSSIILSCLSQWRKIRLLARPHPGLKLNSMSFLDISHVERLSRILDTTTGLIVNEVSSNCAAEKIGVRVGDIILSCQGVNVSSTTQLETILLGISEKHLEKRIDLYSKVPVTFEVLHVRTCERRLVTLKLKLSEGIEVFRAVKPKLRQDPYRITMETHDLADKLLHLNLDMHQDSGEGSEKQTSQQVTSEMQAALDAEEPTSKSGITMKTPNLAVKLQHANWNRHQDSYEEPGRLTGDRPEAAYKVRHSYGNQVHETLMKYTPLTLDMQAALDAKEHTSLKAEVAPVRKENKRKNKRKGRNKQEIEQCPPRF